jgi:hypothetical protein
MMATPQQKINAATAALHDIERRQPGLGKQTVQDYINSGFSVGPAVVADMTTIRVISASDADAVQAFFSDPQAVAQAVRAGFAPFAAAIGNPVSKAGSQIGSLPGNILPSIGTGLSNAAGGGVLGPLFQAHIWIRVGEVALGLILIAVGVAKLTNAVPIATKIAKVVK